MRSTHALTGQDTAMPTPQDDPSSQNRASRHGLNRVSTPGLFPISPNSQGRTFEAGSLFNQGYSPWLNGGFVSGPALQQDGSLQAVPVNDGPAAVAHGFYQASQRDVEPPAFDPSLAAANWAGMASPQIQNFPQPRPELAGLLVSPLVDLSPFGPSISRGDSDSGQIDDFVFGDSYMGVSTPYTAQSDSSVGSVDSFASSASKNLRKRRRRKPVVSKASAGRQLRVRKYQCTFCTDSFKTKYDWQRHETSVHLSLEQWQCAKSGPFVQQSDGVICCVFCGQLDPTPDHTLAHNYSACLARPPEERIFRRKDHLRQHLRIVHNKCLFNENMEAWFSAIDMVNSRCGFCDVLMTTWTERQRHLASHFKQGAGMKEWKGGRGFDDHIDDLVENDMPAFMIGEQHDTMEPFSASQASHVTGPTDLDVGRLTSELSLLEQNTLDLSAQSPVPQATAHSYRQVESLLLAHVSHELGHGRVPTDGQLRTKTSEIMYGPGNAWDQTWADNLQWLGLFKKKAGLIELPHGSGRNAFIGTDSGLENSEGDGSGLGEKLEAGQHVK